MEAQPVIDILEGVFGVLGIFGLPVAALAIPVSQIVKGIIEVRGSKKKKEVIEEEDFDA